MPDPVRAPPRKPRTGPPKHRASPGGVPHSQCPPAGGWQRPPPPCPQAGSLIPPAPAGLQRWRACPCEWEAERLCPGRTGFSNRTPCGQSLLEVCVLLGRRVFDSCARSADPLGTQPWALMNSRGEGAARSSGPGGDCGPIISQLPEQALRGWAAGVSGSEPRCGLPAAGASVSALHRVKRKLGHFAAGERPAALSPCGSGG